MAIKGQNGGSRVKRQWQPSTHPEVRVDSWSVFNWFQLDRFISTYLSVLFVYKDTYKNPLKVLILKNRHKSLLLFSSSLRGSDFSIHWALHLKLQLDKLVQANTHTHFHWLNRIIIWMHGHPKSSAIIILTHKEHPLMAYVMRHNC